MGDERMVAKRYVCICGCHASQSCSSMLQNDLLLIERQRKGREWEKKGKKVGMQREGKQVCQFYFIERQKRKEQEGKMGMNREKDM